MENQVKSWGKNFEMWNIMQLTSWILYSIAIISFILFHQNVVEGRTLLAVPLSGSSITFGYPTLIFMVGYFIHIWSIYIQKNVKQNTNDSSFLPAFGLSLSVAFAAFAVVVIITLIQG